jgi:hypothetical protein
MITRLDGTRNGAWIAGDNDHQRSTDGAPSRAEVPESVSWPGPVDQLTRMMNDGDAGVAIAAMALQQRKSSGNIARLARDAAYDAEERAQRNELHHMRAAAGARFTAGLLQGGLQLASAATTLASVAPTARAGELQNNLTTMTDGPARTRFIGEKANLDTRAGYLTGAAKGADAGATLGPTLGRLWSENADREAKGASFRGNQAKREIDEQGEQVKESDRSIEKALAFLKEYLATRDAIDAALARRL